jgi:hypothetical protein
MFPFGSSLCFHAPAFFVGYETAVARGRDFVDESTTGSAPDKLLVAAVDSKDHRDFRIHSQSSSWSWFLPIPCEMLPHLPIPHIMLNFGRLFGTSTAEDLFWMVACGCATDDRVDLI